MQGTHRVRGRGLAVLALMFAFAAPAPLAHAQTSYPTKPIRVIIPFGAGGSSDQTARVLQAPLQQALGQPIVIEHRPGAGSNIGSAAVARAEPDGYTLMITSSAFMVNPSLYANCPYDPVKHFAPIADLADAPNVLVATQKSGLKSIADVVARAKSSAGRVTGATPGIGTTPHLSFELFKSRAGIDVTLVPYQGGGPGVQAVLSNTTDLFFSAMPNVHPHIKEGTILALGVASAKHWPDLPDVPLFIESGYPNFVTDTGHLFLAPAGTPAPIIEMLSKVTVEILGRPEIKEQLLKMGFFAVGGDAEAARARIARDVPFYREIIATAKLRID